MPRHQTVHRHGIQLAQRKIGGVGQVNDDDIKLRGGVLQPLRGIVVDDAQLGMVECVLVQGNELGGGLEGARHIGV